MKKRTIKKLLALMTAAAMTVSGGASPDSGKMSDFKDRRHG